MVTKKALNCIKTKHPSLASRLRPVPSSGRILLNNHTLVKFDISPNSNNPAWNKQLCTNNGIDFATLNSEINEEFPSDANTEWV